MNRVAMSQGMGHVLQRINLPTIAVQAPGGDVRAVGARWGVPWALEVSEVDKAARIAERAQLTRAERHFPDSAGERLWYYDNVTRQNISGALMQSAAADPDNLQPIICEIARAPVREYGMGVLERIATYVRYQSLNAAGNPQGAAGALGDFATFGPGENAMGGPFPFPVQHANADGPTFSVSYVLVFQNTPMTQQRDPEFTAPAVGPGRIARGHQWRAWDDQRYTWGSRFDDGHQIIFGGHGILRLYAIVTQTLAANRALTFELIIAGRLTGYTQSSGVRRAAILNSTIRR